MGLKGSGISIRHESWLEENWYSIYSAWE